MSEQLDIVKLIEENPITKLTNIYQSKLINKIKNKFNTEEQQLFVASFYCYLNYKKEDFVIDLNGIWKWLGFSSKHKAKELLLKHFSVEIDYKITLTQAGENLNIGGRPMEQILLTISTFKRFCLRASTKKAVQIHEYFINLEETLHEVLDEESNELRQQLQDKQYQLEQKQLELEQEKKNKNWLMNRRYQHEEAKQCVYLYKDNNDYKIGKSEKGIAEREKAYSNMSRNGEIVYFQNCLNCNLTEKVLHHILDKYRTIRNREWFNFSKELAIKTIKSIIYIIDSQMESIEEFIPKLHSLLEIKEDKNDNIVELNNIECIEQHDIINPKNFDKFIKECCELSPEYKYPKADIKQAHRVWSKCATKDVISDLDKYLKDNFYSGVMVDKDDVKRNVYKGIRLKPLIYKISDKNMDYEQFILQECKVDWECRISYVDFFNYFIEWKRKTDTHYKLKHSYRKEIQKYLEEKFAGGRVHLSGGTKSTHLFGAWGLGHKSNNFGLKVPKRTTKKIGQYDLDNNLVNEWESLSVASRQLGIPTSTLCNYARFGNIINNKIYKYII